MTKASSAERYKQLRMPVSIAFHRTEEAPHARTYRSCGTDVDRPVVYPLPCSAKPDLTVTWKLNRHLMLIGGRSLVTKTFPATVPRLVAAPAGREIRPYDDIRGALRTGRFEVGITPKRGQNNSRSAN